MLLRSGTIIRDAGNVTVRVKNTSVGRKYRAFRATCMDFIEELNGATCYVNTIHIIYRMYVYIDNEMDNISSYLNLHPELESFLSCVVNNIPKHIQDIIYYEKNDMMGATWYELTGFTAIEIARMMYEVRLNVRAIIDVFGN